MPDSPRPSPAPKHRDRRGQPRLDGPVATAFRAAIHAHGEFGFSLEQFASHVAAVAARLNLDADATATLCLADLFLTLGCLRGDERAYRALLQRCERPVLDHACRAGIDHEEAREEWQVLLMRLLDRGEDSPLRRFTGRGDLVTYLRVTHLRGALRKRRARAVCDLVSKSHEQHEPSAATECLKREREAILTDVVRGALRTLARLERRLLQRHNCERQPLTRLVVDLGLLPPDTPHLRTAASRLYQRILDRFRRAACERARSAHGVEEQDLRRLFSQTEAECPLHDDGRDLPHDEETR